jgi:hypothetical protein
VNQSPNGDGQQDSLYGPASKLPPGKIESIKIMPLPKLVREPHQKTNEDQRNNKFDDLQHSVIRTQILCQGTQIKRREPRSPKNAELLDSVTQRRIPCISSTARAHNPQSRS